MVMNWFYLTYKKVKVDFYRNVEIKRGDKVCFGSEREDSVDSITSNFALFQISGKELFSEEIGNGSITVNTVT